MFDKSKVYIGAGCFFLATAGALAAFGTHGPAETMTPEVQLAWDWAVEMQFFHGLGLVLVGVLLNQFGPLLLVRVAGVLMMVGIFMFSGLIYLEKLGAIPDSVADIVPIGGALLMASWLLLAIGIVNANTDGAREPD
jgi:uncharacterized membrane protein YgdD (TMEM256/DUF423 family)